MGQIAERMPHAASLNRVVSAHVGLVIVTAIERHVGCCEMLCVQTIAKTSKRGPCFPFVDQIGNGHCVTDTSRKDSSMAMTPAEKMRSHRQRQREKREKDRRTSEADSLRATFRTPFFEWLNSEFRGDWSHALDNAGFNDLYFVDDSGPVSKSGLLEHASEQLGRPLPTNSLGRAELILGALLDVVGPLADAINEYKRSEIAARIVEFHQADLSDPDAKAKAFVEVERLNKMLAHLSKQVRWSFSQWKVTGE